MASKTVAATAQDGTPVSGTGGAAPGAPGATGSVGVAEALAWLDGVDEAVVRVDRHWRVVHVNRRFAERAGRAASELVGADVFRLFPEAQGSVFEEAAHRAMASGAPVTAHARVPRGDRWVEARMVPDAQGLTVFSRDVSAQHALEESVEVRTRQQATVAHLGQLALAGAPMQELLDRIATELEQVLGFDSTAVLEWLPEGHELRVLAGTGWKPGTIGTGRVRGAPDSPCGLAVRTLEPVVVNDIRADPRFRVSPLVEDHGLRSGITVPVVVGGAVWGALAVFSPGRRDAKPADVHFMQSLSHLLATALERDRREADLRRHRDQLEQLVAERTDRLTESLRELESFSYSVSHDLRTPLRAVGGFSDLLAIRYRERLPPEGQAILERIRTGARQMGDLIEDLLTLSRLGTIELDRSHVDVTRLAKEILLALRARHPERDVSWHVEPGLAVVAQANLARIVFENLLANAWKFTSRTEGARIEVRRGAAGPGEPPVVCVADNGAGFRMEHAGKLFQPFQRLHGPMEFEGTGIGLATVARILGRHGGRAWGEGEPGRGARFYVTFGPESGTGS